MNEQRVDVSARRDVIWQDATVAADYRQARRGLPFADAHFEIADRIIQAHGLDVRWVLDLGAGDGMALAAMVGAVSLWRKGRTRSS